MSKSSEPPRTPPLLCTTPKCSNKKIGILISELAVLLFRMIFVPVDTKLAQENFPQMEQADCGRLKDCCKAFKSFRPQQQCSSSAALFVSGVALASLHPLLGVA
jgi:hypothetical protein